MYNKQQSLIACEGKSHFGIVKFEIDANSTVNLVADTEAFRHFKNRCRCNPTNTKLLIFTFKFLNYVPTELRFKISQNMKLLTKKLVFT